VLRFSLLAMAMLTLSLGMTGIEDDRALWIAHNVLPHEHALRAKLAQWRLPQDLDADDLVQEVYCRFATMDSIEGVRHPRNYMFTVARNIFLMHIRRARVVSILSVDNLDSFGLAADEPSPEEHVSGREELHRLAMAVAEMPEPGRSAFLMRVIEELPHRKIGERLGLSDNAVQKSIAKSLKMLVERLGRGGNLSAEASHAPKKDQHLRHDEA